MNKQDKSFKYVFKIILVGPVSVGKTSVMNQFINGKTTDMYQPTLGVEHFNKIVVCDQDKIQVMIWDTAGSEAFRSTAGIILLFDLTDQETFNQIDFWLAECKANSSQQASIFLLGNKIDLQEQRQVSYAEASLYAQRNGLSYMEVSAKNNINIQEAFMDIIKDIHQKVIRKQIDPYDKEGGAWYSEQYLMALRQPQDKKQLGEFQSQQKNNSSCC